MEQFSLEKYFENPSRKVVTRQGKSVRIICTDRRHTDSWPIVALEDYGDGEFVIYANIDGRTDMCSENIHDLFFADEEEGLTEFDKCLLSAFYSVAGKAVTTIGPASFQEDVNEWSKTLLDLARKEILKDLPKWKKATENKDFDNHVLLFEDENRVVLTEGIYKDEYYIELDNLKNLPKEE